MAVIPKQERMIRAVIADQSRWKQVGSSIRNWWPIWSNDCSTKDLIELETAGYFESRNYGPATYGHTEWSLTAKAILEYST